jgi:hypothetical protein
VISVSESVINCVMSDVKKVFKVKKEVVSLIYLFFLIFHLIFHEKFLIKIVYCF